LGFKKGGHPKDKIIPQIVLRAKEANVAAFLLGLNQGDGSNRVDAENYFSTVNFFTTSENVKDGIIFLLHKLGIVSSVAVKERKEPRKVLYIISVSGGKDVNALREAFRGEKPYDRKSLVIPVPSELMHIRENSGIPGVKKLIPRYLRRRCNISLQKLRKMVETLSKHRESLPENQRKLLDKLWRIVEGDLCFLKVNKIREVANPDKYVYDLKVNGRPVFLANWIYAHNSMDAPLIFSTSINPAEIDKEAHNMDVMERYPLEFYEATQRYASPVETAKMMETVECRLGTEAQYEGLKFSFDTSDIAAGPHSSRYKTLETMEEKTSAQLELAKKIRAVDERDVAERLIEHHFIPDLKGNIRTFASQNFRCVACNSIHRRVPLSGVCNRCGGKLVLTVTRGGVEKYLQVAMRVADDYHVSEYTKQRLGLARDDIKSMFESDARRQLSLADFL
jgi:DNA polymerase II large subunit